MKKLLFLLLLPLVAICQDVDWQTEILTRPTAEPCVIVNSVSEFKGILANNDIDYIIIDNHDTVNVFYYEHGELNILRPGTSDAFWAVRDDFGRVVSYPYLFFDNSTHSRNVSMRIGVCSDCKNSTIGVQFGYSPLAPNPSVGETSNPQYINYEANGSKAGFYRSNIGVGRVSVSRILQGKI